MGSGAVHGPEVSIDSIPIHPLSPTTSKLEREFTLLEREILHHVFKLETGWAVVRGLHAYDGYLSIIDRVDTDAWVVAAQRLLETLESFDTRALPSGRQVDLQTLRLRLERNIFYLVDYPSPDFSPFEYLFPIQLTEYVSREYSPVRHRAEAVVRQLRLTPHFLHTGYDPLLR